MPRIRSRHSSVSLPFNGRFDTATETAQCRYLLADGEQCSNDVELEHEDIRICRDHARAFADCLFRVSHEWITEARENHPGPPVPFVPPLHDPRRAQAVVYYLRFGNRIKIGTTINLKNRLISIPHDEVLVTEPGTYERENMRHRQFAHAHIVNEWFRGDDPKLLAHIGQLRRAAGLS